jgi:hypothetical protein
MRTTVPPLKRLEPRALRVTREPFVAKSGIGTRMAV